MTTKETKETQEREFDLRLIERKLRVGKLDPKEYEAYLKRLPNDEERGEYIEVYEEPSAEADAKAGKLTFT
jgi:hypothetical protein